MECHGSEMWQKGFWYSDKWTSTWCYLSTGNKTRAESPVESLPVCQLWLPSQIAEASWPVAMWRSLNLHQERTLPQVCSDWLSPPGGCSPDHTGWCSYHYPFCLHPRQQQPNYQRSVTSDQKHQRTDTYLGWLQWTQLFVEQSWCW